MIFPLQSYKTSVVKLDFEQAKVQQNKTIAMALNFMIVQWTKYWAFFSSMKQHIMNNYAILFTQFKDVVFPKRVNDKVLFASVDVHFHVIIPIDDWNWDEQCSIAIQVYQGGDNVIERKYLLTQENLVPWYVCMYVWRICMCHMFFMYFILFCLLPNVCLIIINYNCCTKIQYLHGNKTMTNSIMDQRTSWFW